MTIDFAELGQTSISVSRLCIGTWQAHGWASSDDDRFVRTVEAALASGLNFIDTAEAYGNGHSEKLVAKAIKGRRSEVVIATKFLHSNSDPAKIRKALERSLKNLGTDYIDLYQQHWPPKSPPLGETLEELFKLKEQGLIRAIGVSNWMEPEFDEIGSPEAIDSLQPCHSLLWRAIEPKVLPLCLAHQIAVLPYSPLCQGILTGRFRSQASTPNDSRKKNRLLSERYLTKTNQVLDLLENVATKYEKSLGQTALRWLLDQEGITAPIVGASRPEQVEENLGAFGWKLEDSDWEELARASWPLSEEIESHDSLWNWHPRR